MFRVLIGCVVVVVFSWSTPALAAQQIEELGESSWLLRSEDPRSANSVVFAGEEYTLLVDPGRTPAEALMRIELAEALSGTRVGKIVLTSADASCALGVLLLEERPFEVACHGEARRFLAENAARLLREQRGAASTLEDAAVFDARRFRLPDRALSGSDRFHLGGHNVRSAHLAQARTPGDLAVLSSRDSVMAIGALGFYGYFPVLPETADLRGWAYGLGSLGTSNKAKFVPARGSALNADQLAESRGFLEALLEGTVETPASVAKWRTAPEAGCSSWALSRTSAAAFQKRTRVGEGLLSLGFVARLGKAEDDGEWLTVGAPAGKTLADLRLDLDQALARQEAELEALMESPGWPESDRNRYWDALGEGALSPAVTADRRLAFVPSPKTGRVACFDLLNEVQLPDAMVGGGPGDGAFIKNDTDFVLPVASKNSLMFVNAASREITHLLHEGIGPKPVAIQVSPSKRLGLVLYEDETRLTAVDLTQRRVIGHATLSEPIRSCLFVGDWFVVYSGEVMRADFYRLADEWCTPVPSPLPKREVAVMGMIHSGHLTSEAWGLEQVAETIRRFKPDAVLVEIPPDRWEKTWTDFAVRGVIEEPRVSEFPEYNAMMLDLAVELGFEIVPCAAWTEEMNDLRRERLRTFKEEPEWAEARAELAGIEAETETRWKDSPVHAETPEVIHSAEYDRYVEEVMDPIGRLQNEMVGPGGWYNINRAHMRLVHQAIDERPGKRLLVTFGAYHKYMFLKELRERTDVELLELEPYFTK